MFDTHAPDQRRRLRAFGITEIDIALLVDRGESVGTAITLAILDLRTGLEGWPEVQAAAEDADVLDVLIAHWKLLGRGALGVVYCQSAAHLAERLIRRNMPVQGIALVNALIAKEASRILATAVSNWSPARNLQPTLEGVLRKLAWMDSAFLQDFYWHRALDLRSKAGELENLAVQLTGLMEKLAAGSCMLSSSLDRLAANPPSSKTG